MVNSNSPDFRGFVVYLPCFIVFHSTLEQALVFTRAFIIFNLITYWFFIRLTSVMRWQMFFIM